MILDWYFIVNDDQINNELNTEVFIGLIDTSKPNHKIVCISNTLPICHNARVGKYFVGTVTLKKIRGLWVSCVMFPLETLAKMT